MIALTDLKRITTKERVDIVVIDTTASPEMKAFADNLIESYKSIRHELTNTVWRPKFLHQLSTEGLNGDNLYSRLRDLYQAGVETLAAFRKSGGSQWDSYFLKIHHRMSEIGADLDDLELHGNLPRMQADRWSIHGKLAL